MANQLENAYEVSEIDHLRSHRLAGTAAPAEAFRQASLDAFDELHPLNDPDSERVPTLNRMLDANIDSPAAALEAMVSAWRQAQGLRHSGVIDAQNAARWILNVFLSEPARLNWHVDRLDGVSASTGWAYVAESRGERSRFTTARELDQARLMMRVPVEPTWPMYRGTMLEEVSRRLFYIAYPGFAPDAESLNAIRAVRGTRDMPWLIGNPDDVAINTKRNGQQARVLIDYKCPTERKDEHVPPPPDYITQLHHYVMMGVAAQRPVSAAIVVNLYVAQDIARLWADQIEHGGPDAIEMVVQQAKYMMDRGLPLLEITPQQVAADHKLMESMRQVYSQADARVLRGEFARWPLRREVEIAPAALERAQALEDELSRTLVYAKALEGQAERFKAELKSLFKGVQVSGNKAPLPLLSVQTPRAFDAPKALEHLQAIGIETKDLGKNESKFVPNKDRIIAVLEKHSIPTDLFEEPGFKVGLTLAKKGPARERLDAYQAQATREVEANFPYQAPPAVPAPETAPAPAPEPETMRG